MEKYKYIYSFRIKDGRIEEELSYCHWTTREQEEVENWLQESGVLRAARGGAWWRVAMTEEEADEAQR